MPKTKKMNSSHYHNMFYFTLLTCRIKLIYYRSLKIQAVNSWKYYTQQHKYVH